MSDCSYSPLYIPQAVGDVDVDTYSPESEASSRSCSILDSAIDALQSLYKRADEGLMVCHNGLSRRSVTYSYYFSNDNFNEIWGNDGDALKNILGLRNYLRLASQDLRNDRDYVLNSIRRESGGSPFNFEFASEELKNDPIIISEVLQFGNQEANRIVFEQAQLRQLLTGLFWVTEDKRSGVIDELCKIHSPSEIAKQILQILLSELRWRSDIAICLIKASNSHVILAAVKESGGLFEYAPDWLRNDRVIVLAAVESWGGALKYASDQLKNDRAIVQAAVEQKGLALKYASRDLRADRAIVQAAVKQNGLALKYADIRNRAIVLAAVRQNGLALEYAPSFSDDEEIVQAAVEQNSLALKYASRDLRADRAIVQAAVEQNGLALEHASRDLRADRAIVQAAVEQNGLALEHASRDLRADRAIVQAAVEQNGLALEHASFDLRADRAIVQAAVEQNGLALQHASLDLSDDREIVQAAVEQNSLALQYASPPFRGAFKDVYILDLQKVEKDPLSVLRDLQELLRKNRSFPKIVYKGSEGIDAGGLSRDLVTRLFKEIFQKENSYLPVFEWEEDLLPVVHADFDSAEEKYETQLLYQAIGMIFAAAIQNGRRPIVTGEHFHALLFELLYSLSPEDIRALPARFTSLDDFPEGESLLRKMLLSHLGSKIDGTEEQKKEIAEELVGAFLENGFPDSFGIYDSKEEFLEMYPRVGTIVQAAPGVLAIAQGMHLVLQNWELNVDSAGKLQLNIEGYFSRDAVLQSLSWKNVAGGVPEQDEQTKEFFKQWFEDETTSVEMISDFLFALTGSFTLRDGQNLLVSFYSAEGPEEGLEWFPKFHTCSSSLDMPRNYSDYATFKKMLEAGIRSAKYGFQAR